MFAPASRFLVSASRSTLARAAPRVAASPARRLSLARPSSQPFLAPLAALKLRSRGFGSSAVARGQGETDNELSARLAQEITYEKETAAQTSEKEPDFLKAFKEEGIWKIEDKAGNDEIALTRQFGNENIRVLFSIGDIDTTPSYGDEEFDAESEPGATAEGTDAEGEGETSFPVRTAITVTKPDQGALTIDAVAQDGLFALENISFYKDEKLATELSADADWSRRGLYIGPQFETLDENVQTEFERFLEERGVGTQLALFIPDYAEWKEQKEYVDWLENVKKFVDA